MPPENPQDQALPEPPPSFLVEDFVDSELMHEGMRAQKGLVLGGVVVWVLMTVLLTLVLPLSDRISFIRWAVPVWFVLSMLSGVWIGFVLGIRRAAKLTRQLLLPQIRGELTPRS